MRSMEKFAPLYLHKEGSLWRMDGDTMVRFTNHICRYFKKDDELRDLSYDRVVYAETDYNEIVDCCMVFGGYFKTPDTLLLAPVYPVYFWTETGDKITLILCVEKGGIQTLTTICIRA